MNTTIKTKVNRLGRVGQIIAILLIVSAVISSIFWIANTVDTAIHMIRFSNPAGDVWIDASDNFQNAYLLTNQITAAFNCCFSIVVYVFLLRTASEFRRCDSPFEEGVIRRMRVFAWILLAYSAGSVVLYHVPNLVYSFRYPATLSFIETFSSILLPSFSLAIALIVLFLVRIFRYGAELQKESDETL